MALLVLTTTREEHQLMSTTTKAQQQEQAEAVERLREWLKPGDTVYCVLRHVSKSGMLRVIQLVKPEADGSIAHLGWNAAKALDYRYDEQREGLKVTGAGMDMGFHVVHSLARTLWSGDDPAVVAYLDEKYPYRAKQGPSNDSGYALESRWI